MVLADSVRSLVAGLERPIGLPSLVQPLRLAMVLVDAPEHGFAIEVGTDWVTAVTDLDGAVIYDAALAVPAQAAIAILTGAVDLGEAAHHGTFTGSMASQSACSLIVELVAERWA